MKNDPRDRCPFCGTARYDVTGAEWQVFAYDEDDNSPSVMCHRCLASGANRRLAEARGPLFANLEAANESARA